MPLQVLLFSLIRSWLCVDILNKSAVYLARAVQAAEQDVRSADVYARLLMCTLDC